MTQRLAQPELRLLVLTDMHYALCRPEANPAHAERRCELGCELTRRAIQDATRRGGFDAIAVLGDLIDDGNAALAEADLLELAAVFRQDAPGVPLLIVPGNHDGDYSRLFAIFGDAAGPRHLCGYTFITFADRYKPGDVCTRNDEDRRLLDQCARRSEGPIIVLQHNPVNPVIDGDYPYMLTNRGQVMSDYSRTGVLLSISGHYHDGQALNSEGGVLYYTAPSLSEAPFPYTIIHMKGREVTVEPRRLMLQGPPAGTPIWDCHVHTEFAYCGRGITAKEMIERAGTFGLEGLCLVEHAPQLYCDADDFWVGNHIRNPKLWRAPKRPRMAEFCEQILPLRSDYVRVGLEVELDVEGQLTLHEEDRDWPDLLVGAVHFLEAGDIDSLSDEVLIEQFMKACRGLLEAGVDVLAHPWRLFGKRKKPVPPELYEQLADMLAGSGTAAEINFHIQPPDAHFFRLCLDRGVKITFGSDAHRLHDVGNLWAHLALLREAAGTDDPDKLRQLMFVPPAGARPTII